MAEQFKRVLKEKGPTGRWDVRARVNGRFGKAMPA
jgi:hypothetical protein